MCFFWVDFTEKSAEKKTRLKVIMKIDTHKSQKTKEKLQNKQWELSELSFDCYLEFLKLKLFFFWVDFTKKSNKKKTRLRVIAKKQKQ